MKAGLEKDIIHGEKGECLFYLCSEGPMGEIPSQSPASALWHESTHGCCLHPTIYHIITQEHVISKDRIFPCAPDRSIAHVTVKSINAPEQNLRIALMQQHRQVSPVLALDRGMSRRKHITAYTDMSSPTAQATEDASLSHTLSLLLYCLCLGGAHPKGSQCGLHLGTWTQEDPGQEDESVKRTTWPGR